MKFKKLYTKIIFLLISNICIAQNSMVGDGFGGRLWYNPTNYTVGSYSAYSICQDICGTGDTQLYGWGDNNNNQLGLGNSVWGDTIPQPIPNTEGVTYYSTGYIMGAIKNDSSGWAWGGNILGYPIKVIDGVKFLDASSVTISFVKYDGTVWSIGDNTSGQFGDGSHISSDSIPIQMQNINNAVRVANNGASTIILLNDSTLKVVGKDYGYGYLGLGDTIPEVLSPTQITGIPKIVDIKSNAVGSIALTANGDVYFWGVDPDGSTYYTSPIKMPNLSDIVAISGCDDGYHFLALDENKNCYAWGDNWDSQFGLQWNPLNPYNSIPQFVTSDVIDIMAGETFSYIVKSDGSLWSSGSGMIWLNISNYTISNTFLQLDPSQVPGACELVGITPYFTDNCDRSNLGTITIDNYGGQAPYTFSIGGAFQSSNIFINQDTGTYTITVKDVNGCQYSTTASILEGNCPVFPPPPPTPEPIIESSIEIPNVFSPNNDGFNDVFYFPSQNVTDLNCKIFNRWGEMIYEFNQVNASWDGRTNTGSICPDGTYYFIVNYKKVNSDWETAKGFVTLLR